MADPTQVVQYQTGLPPETALYGQQLLGAAAGLIYDYAKDASGKPIMVDPKTGQPTTDGTGVPQIKGFQPYQQYTGDRTAQFTPLQQQSFQAAQNMGVDPSTAAAARGLQSLAQSAAGTSYNAFSGEGPQMQGPRDVSTQGINAASVNFGGYNPFTGTAPSMKGPGDVSAQDIEAAQTSYRPGSITDAGVMSGYMSPYMQNVVDVQQQQAKRQAAIAQQALAAQAARSGAFGGSGAALQRAQANAELQRNLQGIQATGLQTAYQQGMQQFNTEQAAKQQLELSNLSNRQQAAVQNAANRLQAAGMNQQAAYQTALQNMQSQLQTQALGEQSRQYGAGLGLQAATTNAQLAQQAAIQSEANRLQAQGMNQQAALATAQANLQARLQTQQLGEQSRQYGAGLGLQGLQTGIQGLQAAGQMGQTAFNQQQAAIGLQNTLGTQQQQQMQNILNTQYQDFQNAQNLPYKQLGFMSDMIRGLPVSQTSSSMYQAPPTATQNLLSTGLGVAGISSLLPKASGGVVGSYADGGMVNSYAGGGSVLSRENKEAIVDGLHPYGLPRALQGAQMRGDIDTYNATQSDMAMNDAIRRGIALAAPYDIGMGHAAGGIVAFAGGGTRPKTADEAIGMLFEGEEPTESSDEDYEKNIERRRGLFDRLVPQSEVNPILQQEIARRQAGLADIARTGRGTTLLRMAAALQKSGVNPSDRYGGMFEAAATGAEKLQAAEDAANNDIMKANLLMAQSKDLRNKGLFDKAVSAEEKALAMNQKAFATKQANARTAAQIYGPQETAEKQIESREKTAEKQIAAQKDIAGMRARALQNRGQLTMKDVIAATQRAQDMAAKRLNQYRKTPKGISDKRADADLLKEFEAGYLRRIPQSIGFGPTGETFEDDSED